MRRLIIPVVAILALFLGACTAESGNGDVVSRSYDVAEFSKIDLSLSGEAIVTVGEAYSVSLSTDANLHDLLQIEVRDDTLHLELQNNTMIANPTEMIFTIAVPELTTVTVSGSGEITIEDIEAETLEVIVSSSGEIEIDDLVLDSLIVEVSGSGDVELEEVETVSAEVTISGAGTAILEGETQSLNVTVSGSGDLEAFDFEAQEVTVRINSSGTAQVNADDTLTGTVSGSGDVIYRGNADETINVSGSGEVTQDD